MIRAVVLTLIRAYQAFSRTGVPRCRFVPSCSEYTAQAITQYGAGRGAWMGIKRFVRCHPFSRGGYDPVP